MPVYLMKREDGLYKVGFSIDPDQRRCSLKAQYKQRVTLEATWEHKKARQIEFYVHKILAPYRAKSLAGREIYDATKEEIIAAIENVIQESKNFPIKKKGARVIAVRLGYDLHTALSALAKKDDLPLSRLIRRAIREYLSHHKRKIKC